MNIEKIVDKAVKTIQEGEGKAYLGHGGESTVYAITRDVVLKIHNRCYYHGSSQKSAEYEFELGKELFRQGVQVPQYFGLFSPVQFLYPKLDFFGIFMRRIHGVKYFSLSFSLREEAVKQYNEQKKLIEQLGYMVKDSYINLNTLFDIKNNKLFLYDLVRWERK